MIDSQVMAFSVLAALLTITPGADTMLVFKNVIRGGRGDGVATTSGICSGLFLHAALSALGLSVILTQSASLFQAVKLMGAGYIIWLGLQSIWTAIKGNAGDEQEVVHTETTSFFRCYREGFLTNVLNPKVAVFYLAFLPQFISPGDPVLGKSLLLAGVHFAMGLIWLTILSFCVDKARKALTRGPVKRWIEGFCGTALIALGLTLALDEA